MAIAADWNHDRPISATKALLGTGSIGLVGVGLGAAQLLWGVGLPCPFRALTGWRCPLCGGTHMAAALLRGDVLTAWSANPVALVACVLLGVRALGWLVEAVRDPGAPSRRWLPVSWTRHWFLAVVVVGVSYTLLRNLVPGLQGA